MEFQSTHSLRSATAFTMTMQKDSSFQSTHSLRSATGVLFCTVPRPPVLIHALLAECDAVVAVVAVGSGGFNPRTPCGVRLTFRRGQIVAVDVSIHALLAECDRQKRIVTGRDMEFQSTHSLRSATQKCYLNPRNPRFQSTHSLRSATPRYAKPGSKNQFQSTHSLRSATLITHRMLALVAVSIHALLAECDW